MESLINLLEDAGVPLKIGKDYIEIKNNSKTKNADLKSFNVRTHEYPGFPTDLQAPMVTFLTQVSGESTVFETIYEDRFKFIQNLKRLGADITAMNTREILIRGGKELKNASEKILDSYDIRAGFATVMAALTAEGTSTIDNIYYIDRGYEDLEKRLSVLGVDIKRIKK